MAATQVGICYNTLSGVVRFIVNPSDDSELNDPNFLISGHTFAKTSQTNYNNKTVLNILADFIDIILSSVITL